MGFSEKLYTLKTTDTELYKCPASASGAVHGLVFSNITDHVVTFSLKLFSKETGLTTTINNARAVKSNEEFAWPKPINLMAGDILYASSNEDHGITVILSAYMIGEVGVSTSLVPRGEWSEIEQYVRNNVVSYLGSTYIAVKSSVGEIPSDSSLCWMINAEKGIRGVVPRGEWVADAVYAINDVATSPVDHNLYIAVLPSTGESPTALDSVYWELFLFNDSVSASADYAASAHSSKEVALEASSIAVAAKEVTLAKTSEAQALVAEATTLANTTTAYMDQSITTVDGYRVAADGSAIAAHASEVASKTSEKHALASEQAAATSLAATNQARDTTAASRDKANLWANEEPNVEVEPGLYSAKHWAAQTASRINGGMTFMGYLQGSLGVFPLNPNTGDYYHITDSGVLAQRLVGEGDSIMFNGNGWEINTSNSDTRRLKMKSFLGLDF